jgi:hypothetical protein
MWLKIVGTFLKYSPIICFQGLRKTKEILAYTAFGSRVESGIYEIGKRNVNHSTAIPAVAYHVAPLTASSSQSFTPEA